MTSHPWSSRPSELIQRCILSEYSIAYSVNFYFIYNIFLIIIDLCTVPSPDLFIVCRIYLYIDDAIVEQLQDVVFPLPDPMPQGLVIAFYGFIPRQANR